MVTQNPLKLFTRHPEFLVLTINKLVLQLGGQVSFDAKDLAKVEEEYSGCIVTQDFVNERVTLTLKARA